MTLADRRQLATGSFFFFFNLTLNVPTTHICVEIYDVILTRNCGELLGLGHWCFISNDLT